MDVVTTFENGEQIKSLGRSGIAALCLRPNVGDGGATVQVDPDHVLLLDVAYTNNSRTLSAARDEGQPQVEPESGWCGSRT